MFRKYRIRLQHAEIIISVTERYERLDEVAFGKLIKYYPLQHLSTAKILNESR